MLCISSISPNFRCESASFGTNTKFWFRHAKVCPNLPCLWFNRFKNFAEPQNVVRAKYIDLMFADEKQVSATTDIIEMSVVEHRAARLVLSTIGLAAPPF